MDKLKLLSDEFKRIANNIDSGNSNLTEEECIELIEDFARSSDSTTKFSIYQAAKFLGKSKSSLDKYIKDGKLPEGRKEQGFKEKFYLKKDLIEMKKILNKE
jgi:hypothetical protein